MAECCIFGKDYPVSGIELEKFSYVKTLKFDDNYTHRLYRCPDCGALVFYKYEEVADFMRFDDYEDYYEMLFPVESGEEADRIEKEVPFSGAPAGKPVLRNRWDSNIPRMDNWW